MDGLNRVEGLVAIFPKLISSGIADIRVIDRRNVFVAGI